MKPALPPRSTALISAAAALVLVCAAGCDNALSSLDYVNQPTGVRKVSSKESAWRYADGGRIEVVVNEQWEMPGGEAVPDIDYIYLLLPDQPGQYVLESDPIIFYRLVRRNREELVYTPQSATVTLEHRSNGRIAVHFSGLLFAIGRPVALDGTAKHLEFWQTIKQDDNLVRRLLIRHHERLRTLKQEIQD